MFGACRVKKILFLSQLIARDDPLRATRGDETVLVKPVLEALGCKLDAIDVTYNEAPDPSAWDGVIVGGSVRSANDREPWRVALEDWLGRYLTVPLFGICGAHQLLARALGARVAPLRERQIGVFSLELPGIEGFLGEVIQVHSETVLDVPNGAEVWATDEAGFQAFKYPGHRWTVQFHPEFTVERVHWAGKLYQTPPEAWPPERLDRAIRGGRALLSTWLDGLEKP